jgi:WD40 repeat protein
MHRTTLWLAALKTPTMVLMSRLSTSGMLFANMTIKQPLTLSRDQRNVSAPLRSFLESHTDTVTSLQLHPTLPTLLLSSSTDGLVNIFDTSQADEDDALYQVVNHRSAIAHAGFMYPSTDIFALGTDETMGFYALQSQKEEEEEPAPKTFGDMREPLGCEYLAKMHWVGSQPVIATGKHR